MRGSKGDTTSVMPVVIANNTGRACPSQCRGPTKATEIPRCGVAARKISSPLMESRNDLGCIASRRKSSYMMHIYSICMNEIRCIFFPWSVWHVPDPFVEPVNLGFWCSNEREDNLTKSQWQYQCHWGYQALACFSQFDANVAVLQSASFLEFPATHVRCFTGGTDQMRLWKKAQALDSYALNYPI